MTETNLPDPNVGTQTTEAPATTTVETPVADLPLREQIKSAMDEARQRDEQGRFVKVEGEPKPRETITLPKKDEPKPAGAAPAPATTVKPPDGWTAGAKAKFATLEPDIQQEILRRERESHQKITSQDTDRDFGSKIRKAAEPYTAIIQAEGGDHEAAFRDYLNTAYILRAGTPQQKQAALQMIAQRFNVPLGPLQQQPQPQSAFDPNAVQRLVQAEIQNQRQAWEQANLKGEIESFSAEAGHEHFESVKPIMAALLESGKAETLQDAYNQAIWADPEIRSTLTAAQAQAAQTQQKSRTDAAKRAAASVIGAPGSTKPSNGAGTERSLRDELKANFAAATGRV